MTHEAIMALNKKASNQMNHSIITCAEVTNWL
jgi:hypothetical protein